ncbi:DUF2490 domain-containing protein [Persicitalea jodogahamensis]|uniref:DUF2490 domain-containing protein n=1 Tax=Persicitalea jodogahamensis TaxID=402147 RepID=A0A8J3D6S3_9BACT|nr:DUF2490 domain-containing protein [Persicitalea jodogahamensis]GHB68858.1 hypothetical protein GCM10007390_22920 [Persicitalea jodogahamensis]
MKKLVSFLFLCLLSTPLLAQSTYLAGLLPALNVNQKITGTWRLNYKVESRLLGAEGRFSEPTPLEVQHSLTDLAVVASRKVGLNNSLAGGYLIRLEKGGPAHRLIQQYTLVRSFDYFRLAHRFSADQTFSRTEAAEVRLRYRISFDIPLNGREVDDREFYLKINHEYLNALNEGKYGLEIRFVPSLGYAFNDNNKIEFGVDYRLSDFLTGSPENAFWLPLTWYIGI